MCLIWPTLLSFATSFVAFLPSSYFALSPVALYASNLIKFLESTNAVPEVPHLRPTRRDVGHGVRRGCPRVSPHLRFFFFFLGFSPTRLDSHQCGSIRAKSASIRTEPGWFGQNQAVLAILGRIGQRAISPKLAGNGWNWPWIWPEMPIHVFFFLFFVNQGIGICFLRIF